MSNREDPRLRIGTSSRGLHIEIRPLVRTRRGRIRVGLAAAGLLAAALLGAARLGPAWESGLKRGEFGDLSFPVLLLLSASIGISAPVALIGLAALAFAEETVEVDSLWVTIRTSAFEGTRVRRLP